MTTGELWHTGEVVVLGWPEGGASGDPHELTRDQHRVLFRPYSAFESWLSDGTEQSAPLASGPGGGPGGGQSSSVLLILEEKLVWRTDGTTGGTWPVLDVTDLCEC